MAGKQSEQKTVVAIVGPRPIEDRAMEFFSEAMAAEVMRWLGMNKISASRMSPETYRTMTKEPLRQ